MYKVTHIERYLPDPIVKNYNSVEEIKERYCGYPDVVEDASNLKVGDSMDVMYDQYIDLKIERI